MQWQDAWHSLQDCWLSVWNILIIQYYISFFYILAWSRKSFSDLSHVHINFYANPIICSKCNIKKTDTVHVFGNIIEVRYNKVTYQNMFGRWCLTVNYSLHIHFKQWLLYSQEDKSLDKNLLLPIQLLNNLA